MGSVALVVLTVLLTLGLNSVFRHDEKPTHLGFEDIGELATPGGLPHHCGGYRCQPRELFGVKIPFTQTEIIYSYDVAVKAGLDFDQVEWEVNDEAKEIQVTMPEIRVLSSEVDLESFKLYHENWSTFRPIRTEEFNAAAQAMKVEAQNRAVENGLLDNAQENAERMIQGFIHQNFDPQEYKIVFEYEKEAACIKEAADCRWHRPGCRCTSYLGLLLTA